MYRYLEINTEKNMLLCNASLVGKGELAELHMPTDTTPVRALSNVLRKVGHPNIFIVHTSFNGHETIGKEVQLDERCVLRVLKRNLSGIRLRHFSTDEKEIVNLERGEDFTERKVNRAKTGSVRKRNNYKKKVAKRKN